jgi:hypothetical protein
MNVLPAANDETPMVNDITASDFISVFIEFIRLSFVSGIIAMSGVARIIG